jgi:hypothetical protein
MELQVELNDGQVTFLVKLAADKVRSPSCSLILDVVTIGFAVPAMRAGSDSPPASKQRQALSIMEGGGGKGRLHSSSGAAKREAFVQTGPWNT